MGSFGKFFSERFLKDKLKSWNSGGDYRAVEMLLMMHFQGRLLNCENCEDYKVQVCRGKGLKGYQQVRKCMEGKTVEVEFCKGSVK